MANQVIVLYQPDAGPEPSWVWCSLESGVPPAAQWQSGDLSDLQQALRYLPDATTPATVQLYLFLADELTSFHHLDVPQGVRSKARSLLPVMLEEQLAEDIEQIAVHYTGPSETEQCNTVVWQRSGLEALIASLRSVESAQLQIRLKACLPASVWSALAPLQQTGTCADILRTLPRVPSEDQLTADVDSTLPLQLEQHTWNLITPDQEALSPVYGVAAAALLAAGLYLLNQWLSVA